MEKTSGLEDIRYDERLRRDGEWRHKWIAALKNCWANNPPPQTPHKKLEAGLCTLSIKEQKILLRRNKPAWDKRYSHTDICKKEKKKEKKKVDFYPIIKQWSPSVKTTNPHYLCQFWLLWLSQTGCCEQEKFLSHSPGGKKSKIKVSAGPATAESLLPGLYSPREKNWAKVLVLLSFL